MFATESIFLAREELESLIRQHYEEIALHKDAVPLDPDWELYSLMEQSGSLALYTARTEGRLVGYACFFVRPHIHYKTTTFANNDVLYLAPEVRNAGVGGAFIDHCERELRAKYGPLRVLWHVKTHFDFRPLLHRRGYADEETIVGKFIL